MRRLAIAAALLIAGFAAAEATARLAGLVDFPSHTVNSRIGYIPSPNQSGSFMGTNDWVTNELSMGVERPFEDTKNDVLLVGDSLVWGGNPYRQAEKLGPQLQSHLSDSGSDAVVWPISAGSWAIVNEANWLADHPAVTSAAETVIFVLNSEDFGQPSSWSNPLTHPRERPASAVLFLVSKYLVKPSYGPAEPEMTVPEREVGMALAEAVVACSCPTQIWLHPTKAELSADPAETKLEQEFAKIAHHLPAGVEVHRIRDIPRWAPDLYQDSIHPTPDGLEIIGKAMAATIPK